jgi:uncharacterized RDD family membrane protein YckC
MTCPHCSAEVPDHALYCPRCGNSVLVDAASGAAAAPSPEVQHPASSLGPLWSSPGEVPAASAEGAPEAPGVPPPFAPPAAAVPAAIPAGVALAGAPAVRCAGFWRRFFAYILDFLVASAIYDVLTILGLAKEVPAGGSMSDAPALLKFYAIFIPLRWLYYAISEASPMQATLGKRALELAVRSTSGGRLSFLHASGRFFASSLSLMTFFIGYVMAGFTEKKQALHDMVSGCVVVRRNP